MRLRVKLCLCIVAIAATWSTCNRPVAAQGLNTPPDVQASVQQALALVGFRYHSTSIIEKGEAGQEFEQLLDQIGTQISPELARQAAAAEGADIQAKLILIAWDRQQHPQLYQELGQRYLHYVGDPSRHSHSPPGVLAAHATEKYRLAWECLLLDPTAGAGEFSAIRATDALERIHNDASLTTYQLAYALTADPKTNADAVKSRQQLLLGAMSGFHNQPALLTMLTSMTLSQQQMAHQPKVWNAADYVREKLAPSFDENETDRWRPTVLAAMNLPLPAEQKAFLNSGLKVVPHPIVLPPAAQ